MPTMRQLGSFVEPRQRLTSHRLLAYVVAASTTINRSLSQSTTLESSNHESLSLAAIVGPPALDLNLSHPVVVDFPIAQPLFFFKPFSCSEKANNSHRDMFGLDRVVSNFHPAIIYGTALTCFLIGRKRDV